jgi:hypothetical protein
MGDLVSLLEQRTVLAVFLRLISFALTTVQDYRSHALHRRATDRAGVEMHVVCLVAPFPALPIASLYLGGTFANGRAVAPPLTCGGGIGAAVLDRDSIFFRIWWPLAVEYLNTSIGGRYFFQLAVRSQARTSGKTERVQPLVVCAVQHQPAAASPAGEVARSR